MRPGLVVTGAVVMALLTGGAGATEEKAVERQGGGQEVAPAAWASPRATMETFLGAFYAEGEPELELAASCLDLSGLPSEVRTVRGRELAAALKRVIDRTRFVVLDEVPAESDGAPYVFLRRAEGEVVIARGDDGRWRFTSESVASLPALERATSGEAVVEGVREAPAVVSVGTWLRGRMPEGGRRPLVGLELWQWLGVLVVLLLGIAVERLAVAALGAALERALRRGRFGASGAVLRDVVRPFAVLVMTVCWGVGLAWLALPVRVLGLYFEALRVVAVVVLVLTAYRVADVVSAVLERRAQATDTRFDDLLAPLARKSLKVAVVAIGIVLVAQSLGANITGLVAGLGLGGLAFALAAKETVANLFGSATVLLDRPFEVGDWVNVEGVEGTVAEVGFRSTKVRTFYDSLITLPNSKLISASVDNYGRRQFRRWSTRLGIAYATPPETIDAFCEGVRELIRTHPQTRKEGFHVYLNSFGGSALEILLYVFFDTPDWGSELRERHRLAVDILRLAEALGVELAFPTSTVFLRRDEWTRPEGAGDRYAEVSAEASAAARTTAHELAAGRYGGPEEAPADR